MKPHSILLIQIKWSVIPVSSSFIFRGKENYPAHTLMVLSANPKCSAAANFQWSYTAKVSLVSAAAQVATQPRERCWSEQWMPDLQMSYQGRNLDEHCSDITKWITHAVSRSGKELFQQGQQSASDQTYFSTFQGTCFCLLLHVALNNYILSLLLYQFVSKVKRKAKQAHAWGYTTSEMGCRPLLYSSSWPGTQPLPASLSHAFKCLTSLQKSFWPTRSKCLSPILSLPSFSTQ